MTSCKHLRNLNNTHNHTLFQFINIPYIKYKKRLLLRCIHHFKVDLINNMDDMRISGTEPSSVILSQKRTGGWFQKLESNVQKVPKTS